MCKTKWKKCIINHTDCQLKYNKWHNNTSCDIQSSPLVCTVIYIYIYIWTCKYFHYDGLFNYMEMAFQIEFYSISN